MTEENFETESLEALVERIVQYADEADERILEAARLICVARERVETEMAGEITWTDWARENIKLSESRRRDLQRVADAEDPKKELGRLREMTRKRVENHRQKKKATKPVPLRTGGDETVKMAAGPEKGRPNPSEISSDPGEGHVEERKDEPPLRNGDEDAGAEAAEMPDYRGHLLRWAEDAPLDQVESVWAFIERLGPAESTSDPDQAEAPVAA